MVSFIASLVIFVVSFFAFGLMCGDQRTWAFNRYQFISIFSFVFILFGSFTMVPANTVGIIYSPFRGTSNQTISEGFHWKNVLDEIYLISSEVQTSTVENLTTQTQDAQFLNSTLDIKYKVSSENAFMVFKQYRTLDRMSESFIVPTTQRVVELVTTKYNVIDILGEKRSEVYEQLNKSMAEEFAKYGIDFVSISITDMDAGEQLEAAITAEAVAKKSVETAQQELLKTQTEAQQKSVQAQADQDAAKIKAETKKIEAQAEKDANDLLRSSITDEILRQRWIEKWDGKLPTYYGSEGNIMIGVDNTAPNTTE